LKIPLLLVILTAASLRAQAERAELIPDRQWEALKISDSYSDMLRQAAAQIGTFRFYFADNWIDGPRLQRLADLCAGDDPRRAMRESFNKPVDTEDFLFFLDDLIAQRKLYGVVYVTSSRARSAGILLHPDDVFYGKPRVYGAQGLPLALDKPKTYDNLKPANDGDYPGGGWALRYRDTYGEKNHYAAFSRTKKGARFARRIKSLVTQLRAQGAIVAINSSVRNQKRGYLMWGAFALSRAQSGKDVADLAARLNRINEEYALGVSIKWSYEGDWRRTVESAREMADVYDVVYATERGALSSSHYDGNAVDFAATGLPRKIRLKAPDGAARTFDLSDPAHSRDLSLSPELIEWIELHFKMEKLRSDYPHWENTGR